MRSSSIPPVSKIALFEERGIRRLYYQEKWWFSIIDVVEVLSQSDRPRKYWSDLKNKLIAEGYFEVSDKIGQLKRSRLSVGSLLSATNVWKKSRTRNCP